jgi:hypothetical protein
LDTQAVEEVYPLQWTELHPGSFTYTYLLTATTRKRMYLAINSATLGRVDITTIQHMLPTLELISPSYPLVAGQPISLQLSSSIVSFSSLKGNSTGWRVGLVWPDGLTADLGLMADWEVFAGVVYKWNMTLPGMNLTKVS